MAGDNNPNAALAQAASCVESAGSTFHHLGVANTVYQPITMQRNAGNLHTPDDAASSSAALYDGHVFVAHMLAGAAAGITEHTAMYPVDTIKTRMQALSHPGQRLHGSVSNALRAVMRREGISGLYRGVGAVVWGAGPAHALHFAVYEHAKQLLGGNRAGYQWLPTAAAGAIATTVNDALMTPVDVVKQRLQVAHSPYKGLVDCATRVVRQEGVGALYKSYRTTLLMNIPFTAMHFSVYEGAKKWLLHVDSGDEAAEDRLSVQLVAGGCGSAGFRVCKPTCPGVYVSVCVFDRKRRGEGQEKARKTKNWRRNRKQRQRKGKGCMWGGQGVVRIACRRGAQGEL